MRIALMLAAVLLIQTAIPAADDRMSRLEFLLEQADGLAVAAAGADGMPVDVQRRGEPLLKFTNPLFAAQSDGVLLLWTDGDAPVFLGSYAIRKDSILFRELSLVGPVSCECRRNEKIVWSPEATSHLVQDLPDAPEPAADARLRLLQMKQLVGRFQVGEMRVMPTPLYRYSSSRHGIVDGALFAFTDTTDPEMIVSLTAVRRGDEPVHWEYGLCRMNSAPRTVLLDGREVWSVSGYWKSPRTRQDPYVEQRDVDLPEELKLGSNR